MTYNLFSGTLNPTQSINHSPLAYQLSCGPKFTMCGSMVDIQSATTEIRQKKKKDGKN